MSKEATRNQLADILAREAKKLGLEKPKSPEQHVYAMAEAVSKDVVNMGRFLLAEIKSNKQTYNRDHLKEHMQKEFQRRFEVGFTKEEMAFLLSVIHTEETINAVEA